MTNAEVPGSREASEFLRAAANDPWWDDDADGLAKRLGQHITDILKTK